MRNYIILNGNNSNEITGLLIQSLPPISKPLMRTAIEEIDGRDGDIVTTLGYSAYDKELSIGLYGSYDVDEVIKYFNDNSKGQVTFSNEPDKYYNYEIINQIDFERLIRFKTATVTLHCQPFKYPTEETPVEIAYQYVNNEAEEMDLDNTADAPMEIDLKGNTSQASDPTPDSPVDINVVSGDNTIEICGKNLWNENTQTFTNQSRFNHPTKDSNNVWTFTISGSNGYAFATSNITLQAGTYTASATVNNGDFLLQKNGTTINNTFTLTEETEITFRVYKNGNVGDIVKLSNVMIEKNNQATTYEPYTSQSQLISLGVENLFDINTNSLENRSSTRVGTTGYISLKAGTYTLSYMGADKSYYIYYDSNNTKIGESDWVNGTCTFTLSNDYKLVLVFGKTGDTNISASDMSNIQLEKGSKKNSYSPYGTTPIELNKISTYQDYIYRVNDRWYLHKEIGKYVLTGEESNDQYWWSNEVNGLRFRPPVDNSIKSVANAPTYCNRFNQWYSGTTANNYIRLNRTTSSDYLGFWFGSLSISGVSSVATFKTYASSNDIILYYPLETPTNTEITDSTLIDQLENIANARSYDTSTHITQNANDKPFILNATAIQKGSDTGIVDNDGNIYSKPTLDIEGTGTVAIYLNGNQMFSVDLSNSDECVIDVTNLEAYDPETNELMNRQVTGDYSNFTLPVGENEVKVSGNVTKATISGYTRWL